MEQKKHPTKQNKQYVQFSKRMVVFVSMAVTALCVVGIGLCALYGQIVYITDILKAYIGYATVCFAAYSGNSVAEKWILHQKDKETDGSG